MNKNDASTLPIVLHDKHQVQAAWSAITLFGMSLALGVSAALAVSGNTSAFNMGLGAGFAGMLAGLMIWPRSAMLEPISPALVTGSGAGLGAIMGFMALEPSTQGDFMMLSLLTLAIFFVQAYRENVSQDRWQGNARGAAHEMLNWALAVAACSAFVINSYDAMMYLVGATVLSSVAGLWVEAQRMTVKALLGHEPPQD